MAETYNRIGSVTVGSGGASTITFSNIPQTYTDLVVKFSMKSTTANQNTDGLFLFFDITNKHSLSILRKKIKTIVKSVGNTVPIVVIANKSDLIESRETSDKKIQVFLDKLNELNSYVQFFETSNKTKQNVNESFKWLLNQMNDSAK